MTIEKSWAKEASNNIWHLTTMLWRKRCRCACNDVVVDCFYTTDLIMAPPMDEQVCEECKKIVQTQS